MLTPVTIVTADAILAMSSITALNGFRNYGKTLEYADCRFGARSFHSKKRDNSIIYLVL